jgi:hypothetical protein
MGENFRKLKIVINKSKTYLSRVVDAETGETILSVSNIDIHLGTKLQSVTITLEHPDIEIENV